MGGNSRNSSMQRLTSGAKPCTVAAETREDLRARSFQSLLQTLQVFLRAVHIHLVADNELAAFC